MKRYITVKRKTVRRAVALAVFLIIAAAASIIIVPRLRQQPLIKVEVLSRNSLTDRGREVAWFRTMDADSTLAGLTTEKDSVKTAPAVWLKPGQLERVITLTLEKLRKKDHELHGAVREMDYYIDTHGVQDEGYDMVAAHRETLRRETDITARFIERLQQALDGGHPGVVRTTIKAFESQLRPTTVVVECMGGRWIGSRWTLRRPSRQGITTDSLGRMICAVWNADSIVWGRRPDSLGTYAGEMDAAGRARGHGIYTSNDGTFYEGHWQNDHRNGFGFALSHHKLKAGEWKNDVYRGERMHYTSDRIYGIDISKYQHQHGRRTWPILWNKVRIRHLGHVGSRNVRGTVDYPISFVYIKSTEGTTVRNPYFRSDYRQARRHGLRCGAYHFFSIRSSAAAQASFFLRQSEFSKGDMPPVLDVEPTDDQIKRLGGVSVMFSHIRTWMNIVERRTGVRPILYVSQRFVNKYLSQAPAIKRDYDIWIARYGEYKPDVRLVYWQLCPDGGVSGITGHVDINVFNGYREKFNEFIATKTVR